MNAINKILKHKYWWVIILLLFPAVTYISTLFRYSIDLTAEKRFSLTEPTKKLLHNLDSAVTIHVFLTGDLPADYKKLNIATQDILSEFRDLSGNKIQVSFEKPGDGLDSVSKTLILKKYLQQDSDISIENKIATYDSIVKTNSSLDIQFLR